jgi:hypothetical protein
MLHYTGMERPARDEHSSLLGPFECYGENEVLFMRFQPCYQTSDQTES